MILIFGGIIAGIASFVSWLWGLFFQGWTGIFFGLILLICLGFFAWLAWNQFRVWSHRRWLQKLPPTERLYQEMLAWLGTKGFRKHPAQTPFEYVHHARPHHSPDVAQTIETITQAYVSWRYGGHKPNVSELREQLQSIKKK